MKLFKRKGKRKKKFFMPNKYMDVIDKIFDICKEYDIDPEELMYIIERVNFRRTGNPTSFRSGMKVS